MPTLELKPTPRVVAACYDRLAQFAKPGCKLASPVSSALHEPPGPCVRR